VYLAWISMIWKLPNLALFYMLLLNTEKQKRTFAIDYQGLTNLTKIKSSDFHVFCLMQDSDEGTVMKGQ